MNKEMFDNNIILPERYIRAKSVLGIYKRTLFFIFLPLALLLLLLFKNVCIVHAILYSTPIFYFIFFILKGEVTDSLYCHEINETTHPENRYKKCQEDEHRIIIFYENSIAKANNKPYKIICNSTTFIENEAVEFHEKAIAYAENIKEINRQNSEKRKTESVEKMNKINYEMDK